MQSIWCTIILGAVAIFTPFSVVCACECGNRGMNKALVSADVAFIGSAMSEEFLNNHVVTTFQVERWLKEGRPGDTIKVTSSKSEAECGIRFTHGLRYQVNARKIRGMLWTSFCAAGKPELRKAPRPSVNFKGAPKQNAADRYQLDRHLYKSKE